MNPIKVFYWPADSASGCFLYRIDMPRRELLRLGHEVQTSQTMGPWAQEEADVIVGQRVATTGPSSMWQIVAAKRHQDGQRPMVYEADDDLFHMDDTNPSAEFFSHPTVRKNMADNLRAADLVTASTPDLADALSRYNDNIVVLPNCVDAAVLDIAPPARRTSGDGITVYGWQGSQTHAADWDEVNEAVVEILTEDRGSHLQFLGHAYPDMRAARTGRTHFRPWTTDISQHYRRVNRFDVTLAPLKGTKFNASKSALRVIESYALGVPVVASDVPAYRGWVRHGVDGFLVRTHDDWVDALRVLRDPDIRARMGTAAREAAKTWTVQGNAHRWVDAYRTLM